MGLFEDLLKIKESLPVDPIAPENRRCARLWPSLYVPRGKVYRVSSSQIIREVMGHPHPLIVLHPDDVAELKASWPSPPPMVDLDQEIADCCEQLFAEQEANRR